MTRSQNRTNRRESGRRTRSHAPGRKPRPSRRKLLIIIGRYLIENDHDQERKASDARRRKKEAQFIANP
jgi:hypothetical protein